MAVPVTKMTLDEYMAWERTQPQRNEFHRGEVFAMTGGRRGHYQVIVNLVSELRGRLRGTPCKVFGEGMKVQIGADTVLYPDVFVTCDGEYSSYDTVIRDPLLVIEVLSPSTMAYDSGRKFTLYRGLPTLREYVLIDPDHRTVQGFRRRAQDEWVLHDMSEGDRLELLCIDAVVPFAELFDSVDPEI